MLSFPSADEVPPAKFRSYLSYKPRKQEILPQPTGVDSDGLVSLVAQHRHATLT